MEKILVGCLTIIILAALLVGVFISVVGMTISAAQVIVPLLVIVGVIGYFADKDVHK